MELQQSPKNYPPPPAASNGALVVYSGDRGRYSGPPARLEREFGEELQWGGLRDYVAGIARRKKLVLITALVGLIGGALSTIPKPFVYSSTVSFEVQGFNERFMNMSSVDPQAATGTYSANSENISTQMRILTSNTLRQQVFAKLQREVIPSLPPRGAGWMAWVNQLRERLGYLTLEPTAAFRQALQSATSSVNARVTPGTRIVELSATSTHPEVAAEFANTLLNSYVEQSLENRAKNVQKTSQWMLDQLEQLKAKVEQTEAKLKQHVSGGGAIIGSDERRTSIADAKLSGLQGEMQSAQAERISRQSRYESAKAAPPEMLGQISGDPLYADLSSQLIKLRQQLAEMSVSLTPANPKIKRLQAQITELEDARTKQRQAIVDRLRLDYEAAVKREQMVGGAYSAQSSQVVAQVDKTMEYNLLRHEVDNARQLYNTMLRQISEASITSGAPTINIRVVDPASPSYTPLNRDLWMRSGAGITAGLLFGIILAVILFQHEKSLHLPQDLSSYLEVPALGVIPSDRSIQPRGWGAYLGRRKPAPVIDVTPTHRDAADGSDWQADGRTELAALRPIGSPIAESFRAAIMSLMFSDRPETPRRVIVVNSPNPREGKSTTTTNLALVLAEIGRRVLIIDGDMRKPQLHTLFGGENNWGLSDILNDKRPMEGYSIEELARVSPVPNLSLMFAGKPYRDLTQLLCSPRLGQLVERLRSEFDFVLIDSPPMLIISDARILAKAADGVVLVLRHGQTTREDALAARQRFVEDGTEIIGSILNGWEVPAKNYGRYESYYRNYYSQARDA